MRLTITLRSKSNDLVSLPCHYNEIVQAFIYSNLDWDLANKIHEDGLIDPVTKRSFRFFTFSRLIPTEKFFLNNGRIYLKGDVKLKVSSPLKEFIRSLALNLLKRGEVYISSEAFVVVSVEAESVPEYKNPAIVKALSPITVYSTLITKDRQKKTYYYSPFEREFGKLIIGNLAKKLRALTGKEIFEGYVKPYRVSVKNQKIVFYKDIVIKAWDGLYEISLPPELYEIAFTAGLGSKNSQGFGFIDLYDVK